VAEQASLNEAEVSLPAALGEREARIEVGVYLTAWRIRHEGVERRHHRVGEGPGCGYPAPAWLSYLASDESAFFGVSLLAPAAVRPRLRSRISRSRVASVACFAGPSSHRSISARRRRRAARAESRNVEAGTEEQALSTRHTRGSKLDRGRSAVEFGRLKDEYGLTPLRVPGIGRVALHADLTMLARLSVALARARAVPLAA
jgi:hypothetical protein